MINGIFIPGITERMFRDCPLEAIEKFRTKGEVIEIEYNPVMQEINDIKLMHLRSSICEVGYKAMCLLNNDSFLTDPTETKKLLNNLRALAKNEGVRDPYEEKKA